MKESTFIKVLIFIVILVLGALLYINNQDYITLFKLYGENEITIYDDEEYKEPGFICMNKEKKIINNLVLIDNSNFNNNIVKHTIIYKIKSGFKTHKLERIINIIENPFKEIEFSLLDSKIQNIDLNTKYKEYGFICKNKITNEDLSKNVTIENNIKNEIGSYKVIYTLNINNQIKKIERNVNVLKELNSIIYNKEYTNTNLLLQFETNIQNYNYIINPNGEKTEKNILTYEVETNGIYTFSVYDLENNKKDYGINITNIDKEKPKGTCLLIKRDKENEVTVNATDNLGIKGYKYSNSQLIETNNYKYESVENNINVSIIDYGENETIIQCEEKDESTPYQRSYKKYTKTGTGFDYWLYIPKKLTKRNKLPLVVYLHGTGECGNNLNMLSFPNYIKGGSNYDFLMVAPQLSSSDCGGGFNTKKVMNVIKKVMSEYPVDETKIIVTGFSLGGVGAFWMIRDYPNFFSAAVPLASSVMGYNNNFAKTPVWAFTGSLDKVASSNALQGLMNKIIAANPNSKYTIVKGYNHNVTDKVYNDKTVIKWMLEQTRK